MSGVTFQAGFFTGSPGGITGRPLLENNALDEFNYPIEIEDPSVYPWRVNCKLWIVSNDTTYNGSAILIDPKHVLTAAHCVYNKDTDEWVDMIEVIPGFDEGNRPYGTAYSVGFLAWTAWVINDDWNWDMAVIELDRPIGALTGWYGYTYNTNDNFYLTNTFRNAAYPAPPPFDRVRLAYRYGPFDSLNANILYEHDTTSFGGMSGGGVYYTDVSTPRTVHAVVSHGYNGCGGFNRMTQSKYNDVGAYMLDHRPASVDLVALDCQIPPASIHAGHTLSSLNFLMLNYSRVALSANVTLRAYLSTNDYISTSDILLGTQTYNGGLGALESVRIDWVNPPAIPCGYTPGEYYVGVLIDYADANSGNNSTSHEDAAPLTISISAPEQASQPTPANSATGVAIGTNLSWTAGLCAQSHAVYLGTTNPPPYSVTQGGTVYNPPNDLASNRVYYWRIDEINSFGTTTGTVWSFTTALPPPPGQAGDPVPADDSWGVLVTTSISWGAGLGYTESFDVYFGTTNPPPFVQNMVLQTYEPPGILEYLTVYYWRIDSRNAGGVTTGNLWNFTASYEPPEPAVNPSPANGATEIPVTVLLAWTEGARTSYNRLHFGTADPPPFRTQLTNPVYNPVLNYNTVYYWRIDEQNSGGITPGPLWTFTTQVFVALPGLPTNPHPADSATGVTIYPDLTFTPGDGAASHELWVEEDEAFYRTWFGTDTVIQDYGPLDTFTTYYWRIKEINSAGDTWGPVWSFTTGEFESAGAPSDLTIQVDNRAVILRWLPSEHGIQYYVHRSTDPNFVPGPTNVVATVWDTTWTDTTVFSSPSDRRFYAATNVYP